MPASRSDESAALERLEAALAEYRERLARGERVDLPTFLAQHGDVAELFRTHSHPLAATDSPAEDETLDDAGPELRSGEQPAGRGTKPRSGRGGEEVEPLPNHEAESDAHGGADVASHKRDDAPSSDEDHPTIDYGTPGTAPRTSKAQGEASAGRASLGSSTLDPSGSARFGDYVLLREIARGGMGAVFLARQVSLSRTVAVKMILAGQLSTEADVRRFHSEAEAAANLQHPGIVAIHDVGEHEGRHYFSMDYIEGRSLADLVREHPLVARKAAEYVRAVADAIHYAHERGILHRDLKPSNILVDADDRPRVTDFGLAKRMEGQSELTASGAILGTPNYMPPEQAAGRAGEAGRASDVYSLGAILYELLTGRPPFRAETPVETLRQVLDAEPAPPRLLNPKVPRDLETICLKCLQKEPARRYATAQELADDLARFSSGEPILARPVGRTERLIRWCRRKPALAALSGALLLAIVVGVTGITIQWRRAAANHDRAEANFARARAAVDEMLVEVAGETLFDVPQMDPVRRRLLERALEFYTEFLAEAPSDPATREAAAGARLQVAEILRLLGEHGRAGQNYREAADQFATLVDDHPNEPRYRERLAECYNSLGDLLRTTTAGPDDMRRAEDAFRGVMALEHDFVAAHPDEADHRYQLAKSLCNLGIVLRDTDRPSDAEAVLTEAIELLESGPPLARHRHLLARSYYHYGLLLGRDDRLLGGEGRRDEAEAAHRAAIDVFEELAAEEPADREYRHELGIAYINLGNLLLSNRERGDEVAAAYAEATRRFSALVADFPGVPLYRRDLANSYNSRGAAAFSAQDYDQAEAHWEQARQEMARLVHDFPDVPDHHHLLAGTLANLAYLRLREPAPEEARRLVNEALEHHRIALDANPAGTVYRRFGANIYTVLVDVAIAQGDYQEAVAAAQEVARLFPEEPLDHYRAAALLARCVAAVEADQRWSESERQLAADGYAASAVEHLREARRLGYEGDLAADPAFEAIRERQVFERVGE